MKSRQRHFLHKLDRTLRPIPCAHLLIVLLAASLFLTCVSTGFADPGPAPLRIGLTRYLKGVSAVDVSCSVDFTVAEVAAQGKPIVTSTYLEPISMLARKDGIEVRKADGKSVRIAGDIRVQPAKPGGLLTISAATRAFSQYRGALEVKQVGGNGLMMINEVMLEDYLLGVLPAEMPSSFQPEALKAQAIAARTYAGRTRTRHAASGYDLCDTVHCQVYLGSGGEKQNTTRAVLETQGLVIKWNGELIWAVYSADCGGRTQDGSDSAIAQPDAYLKSVSDCSGADKPDFCSVNKSHLWTRKYTPQELEDALNSVLKPPVEGLKTVAFCEYDPAGRVKRVDIVDSKGSRSLTGVDFRKACGTSDIRSTKMFVCTDEEGSICFEGRGWGHGVGMCQWGAEGLARAPWNYTCEQILKHYYTGVEIAKLK